MQITISQITDNFAVKWPTDLKELNFFYYDKSSVDSYLRTLIPHYILHKNFPDFVPRGTTFTYEDESKDLFKDLIFLYSSQKKIEHIILSLDHTFCIGSGKDRTVIKCYDLVEGLFFAQKAVSVLEQNILKSLQGKEGIPQTYGFYKKEKILYTIEKFYLNSDLLSVLEKNLLTTATMKLQVMHNILSGLVALHSLRTENNIGFVHFDLKPENILVSEDFTAVLGDYGNANSYNQSLGGIGFYPPEYFDLQRQSGIKHLEQHQHLYGQARDIWALGLNFISILVNPKSEFTLRSIEGAFMNARDPTRGYAINPLKVFFSQIEILKELKAIKLKMDENLYPLYPVYDFVERMLDFNPSNRPTAPQLLIELNEIMKKGEPCNFQNGLQTLAQ